MAGGLLYQGYGKVDLSGKAMPLSRVRVEFEEKFGEPPAEILDGKTCWLAGPIVNVMEDGHLHGPVSDGWNG